MMKKECLKAPSTLSDHTAAISREDFISAMKQAASLVSVITTTVGNQRMALTVGSFLSVSADPPLMSVCVNQKSRMCEAMKSSGKFGVHVLADTQSDVADVFAGRPQNGDAYDFSCVEWLDQGDNREALMGGASISAECEVDSVIDAGSHCIFIGAVVNMKTEERRPLLYWNRSYGFPSHPADR
jgi:flavin reductase (DIM6/NTAB) family NADH-FMN oxidoreductase RutF